MGIANRFNKGNKIDWNYETEGFEFKSPSEMELDKVYPMHGVFTTPDSGYGVGGVIICDDCLLNVPQSYVDTVKEILADQEAIEQIKAGKLGFKVGTYQSRKFKRTGYSVEFVDM